MKRMGRKVLIIGGGGREHALACPENRLGVGDLYQVPHHGGYGAIRPELTAALDPTVVVINNGARKGGTPDSLVVAQSTAGIEDVWQSHRALADDACEERIHGKAVAGKADRGLRHLGERHGPVTLQRR